MCRVAHNIHCCIAKQKQVDVDASLAAAYAPHQCHWDGCQMVSTTWSLQQAFIAHMQTHTHTAHVCGWADTSDTTCYKDGVKDWPTHWAHCHVINMRPHAAIHYCYLCSEWCACVRACH